MNNNKQCALGSWPLAHLNRAIIASLLAIIAIAGCRKAAAPVAPIASAVPARVSMLAPASAEIAPRSAEQAGMAQLRAMPESTEAPRQPARRRIMPVPGISWISSAKMHILQNNRQPFA